MEVQIRVVARLQPCAVRNRAPAGRTEGFAMDTVERPFGLEAKEGLGARPRAELIGPVLSYLHAAIQDALRMAILHWSRARGRVPLPLKAAVDPRFIGHSARLPVYHTPIRQPSGSLFESSTCHHTAVAARA